jgi:N-acetylglucosaminyldiphosphoundecaprenol N-acetyl-beta-D-mannosaminyltransferase
MQLLNFNITTAIPSEVKNSPCVFNTINPHSYCIAKEDKEFELALKESDFLFPDGIGIVWAARFLKRKKIKKIAGYDVFLHFVSKINEEKGSCFFLGASEATLELIKARLLRDFPEVKVGAFSPPYKAVFSEEESTMMLSKVAEFNPDVLFVGMTAPKQEKWVHLHKKEIQADVICSIGAVFDFYAGTVKRPSAFWIKLGLEWLPRLLKEPKRLFKRNFVSTPLFLFYMMKEKVKTIMGKSRINL